MLEGLITEILATGSTVGFIKRKQNNTITAHIGIGNFLYEGTVMDSETPEKALVLALVDAFKTHVVNCSEKSEVL